MSRFHAELTSGKEHTQGQTRVELRIWLNLAWKEWHEHKWEAAVVTAIMLVSMIPALIRGVDIVANFAFITILAMVATIYIAMSIVAGERTDGSLDFAISLPIPRWQAATVRLLAGGCLCVAPIVLTACVTTATMSAAGSNGVIVDVARTAIANAGACLILYFWIVAIAIRQPNQFRVGVVGVLVLLGWMLLAYLFVPAPGFDRQPIIPRGLIRIIEDIGPLGWLGGALPLVRLRASLLVWQPLVLCLLFAVAAANYGLPLKPLWESRDSKKTSLGLPRRSPRSAIAWSNAAELLPVAICSAAFVLAVACLLIFNQSASKVSIAGAKDESNPVAMFSSISLGLGFLWMSIIATTTFVPSLQPAVLTFWRSRPIDPSKWFWSKYWLGALIGIGLLHTPTIVAIFIDRGRELVSPASALVGDMSISLVHWMVYSVSVLAACLLRNVVHAGILGFALPAFVVGIPATFGNAWQVFQVGFAKRRVTEFVEGGLSAMSLQDFDFMPFLLLMLFLSIGSSVAAAHVVKHNTRYDQ